MGRDEGVAAPDHPITVRFKDSMSPGSCIAGLALDPEFCGGSCCFPLLHPIFELWDTTARLRKLGDPQCQTTHQPRVGGKASWRLG